MSDWQVGDLAVCVAEGSWGGWYGSPLEGSPPRNGEVFRVIGIRNVSGITALLLDRYEGTDLWASAHSFRKITPDKHEACEDEFVTLLKRGKVSA